VAPSARIHRRQYFALLGALVALSMVGIAGAPPSNGAPNPHLAGMRGGADTPGATGNSPLVAPPDPSGLPDLTHLPAAAHVSPPLLLGEAIPRPWSAAPRLRAPRAVPDLSARAVVIVDEASGAVLLGHHERRPLPPASLTKMATAILAAEHGDLDAEIETDVDSRDMTTSSVMGLLPGDRFTLRDLLYGLMLPSGNDAALAIARGVSGSDARFVHEMNDLARRLGLTETHFENPHGLSSRRHYSSAYDLAIIARYYMSLDPLPEIAATTDWTASGSREIEMTTLNPLLADYEGADGVKTGYTESAGQTFVASATRDGHRLYVVLLHDSQRAADARALLDWAFASYTWGGVAPRTAVPPEDGDREPDG